MKVYYDPENGVTLPDNKIDEFVATVMKNKADISVGSDTIIYGIRAYMKQNQIDPSEVVIIQNDNQEIRIVGEFYKLVSNHILYDPPTERYLDILLEIN